MHHLSSILPWQTENFQQLLDELKNNRLPHALLLSGPAGIGKYQLARALVHAAISHQPNSEAIEKNHALLEAGTHPDYLEIQALEGKTNISVDQIRELTLRLSLTPQISSIKVVLIQPAESMTIAAANALLKTLEEPAGNVLIILNSHNEGLLPQTIRSRCRRMSLLRPVGNEVLQWLETQIGEDAPAYLGLSCQAPLLAVDYHQQALLQKYTDMQSDLHSLYHARADIVSIVQRWKDFDLKVLINWIEQIIRDAIKLKMQGDSTLLFSSNFLINLKILSDGIDLEKLFEYQLFLSKTLREVDANLNRELFVEQILVRWSALGACRT